MHNVSFSARQELLKSVHSKYNHSNWKQKTKILEGFVAATGYDRKYAIRLLNQKEVSLSNGKSNSGRKSVYDVEVKQVLEMIWNASNQICSKRFVPFIPIMIEALERHGHLSISEEVKQKLLKISAATVDRILRQVKLKSKRGLSTTRTGNLLKNQIKVRTFADWDNVVPGFFECDLVAHCGTTVCGTYLNTLVITDIMTGWTECIPILRKSVKEVISGLTAAKSLLPFSLIGLDTDNGSEFINYELLSFCENNKITFTRSRAYKKNDQAFVEEKNGSIVRRLIGYDRFEGEKAWEALANLYAILRLYINFFQPSLKLKSKERVGSKTIKKYETAKTPFQRTLDSSKISQEIKDKLNRQYRELDPLYLKAEISKLQQKFWAFAWKSPEDQSTEKVVLEESENQNTLPSFYKQTKKIRKKVEMRDWRTRKDPFHEVNNEIELQLNLKPHLTAKSLLDILSDMKPGQFNKNQLRTLQRRVAEWHSKQNIREEKYKKLMIAKNDIATLPMSVNI